MLRYYSLSALFLCLYPSQAFVSNTHKRPCSALCASEVDSSNNPLQLTPELLKIAQAFESIGDDQLRYKQLLYMANQLQPLDKSYQTPANKVPGCLSTVYVHATARRNDEDDQVVIDFAGDSDGLLTKGLVALLIRGLSGNPPEAIAQVDPSFVQKAGIAASLTPGRNNGFLNMLALMKSKAQQVGEEGVVESPSVEQEEDTSSDDATGKDDEAPMYNAILQSLEKLKPESIKLVDVSHQHAGHVEGGGTESHFELEIVAEAFGDLNLVKRHQLIYMMLGEVMPQIHALQIKAQTPSEVSSSASE